MANIDPQHIDRFDEISDGKTTSLLTVVQGRFPSEIGRTIVVGCGDGIEAGRLARFHSCETVGIDLDDSGFNAAASHPAVLKRMDARDLAFSDASFDFVFSFHAIEHIPQPERAMAEMGRVLRPGGTYVIGTPNKRRLVGYINSATTLSNKVRWNINDLKQRLKGEWSNEAGAHAGFTEEELRDLCADAFGGTPRSITHDYYRTLYPGRALELVISAGAHRFVYPCIYVAGRKEA